MREPFRNGTKPEMPYKSKGVPSHQNLCLFRLLSLRARAVATTKLVHKRKHTMHRR